MTPDWPAFRVSIREAVHNLEAEWYQVARVAGTFRLFDLIAWKNKKLLFLVIRSARKAKIDLFPDELTALTGSIKAGTIPGDVQLWIRQQTGWAKWQIFSGGAQLIHREGA